MRMKMYCSDHSVASSSQRPAADEVKRLQVDALQPIGGIAGTGPRTRRRAIGNALHLGRRKPDPERIEGFGDALLPLGPWARQNAPAPREQPREHELRRGSLLLHRHLLEALHDLHVLVEVLVLEARMREPPVAVGQIRLALDRAGEHAAPE